jgi:phage gpG-like protein
MATTDTKEIKRRILNDVRVEAAEQFDRNFETESFFGAAWQRKKSPVGGDHVLVGTGTLRRSVSSRIDEDSITFESTLPYAAIHNEGGEIKVTARMKRYFWAMYYKANGGMGRRKDGTLRKDKKNARLSTEAEFWKHLALMKVGSAIKIPRRRYLGAHSQLETAVTAIIEKRLQEYFDKYEIIKQ